MIQAGDFHTDLGKRTVVYVSTLPRTDVFVYADKGTVVIQNVIRSLGIILSLSCAIYSQNKKLHIVFLTLNTIGLIIFMTQIPT